MSKTGMDGRREPPQTVAIILTLLPSAALALGYVWIATPPAALAGEPAVASDAPRRPAAARRQRPVRSGASFHARRV